MARRLSFVRPCVCKLFCANRYYDAKNASIATKLAQVVLKVEVKVKGHVLWAVLCWHEKRFSSEGNGRIVTKLAHDGLQVSCAQFQGQCQRSRDTGIFVLDLKSLFLAGKWLD